MVKKIALGKGIASLISDTPSEVITNAIKENFLDEDKDSAARDNNGTLLVNIKQIVANPNQPRKIFKEKELEELALSIKENGVIQPVILRKTKKGLELIAGERRLRAAKKAGLSKVPAVIKKVTDREKMIFSLIENVQRSNLNCIEEALAYYQLMDDFNLTQEVLAKKIGKERSSIANFLRILKLPRPVIDLLQKEILSFGHAKILASLKDDDLIIRFSNLAAAEDLSVKDLENLIKGKKIKKTNNANKFFDEKLDQIRVELEKNTGFHFAIKSKKSGSGLVQIKYTNEAEFNDIYEYLLQR